MKRPWLLMLLLSCAPTAEPGGHLAWKLRLEETLTSCGAVFDARELEVELWAALDGIQVLRFVSPEPISLGDASSVAVPAGLWTNNGVFASGDTLALSLAANGDGGVLALASSTCGAQVPFTQQRLMGVSAPLPGPDAVVEGARAFTVAVQNVSAGCVVDRQNVHFEVWQLGDDALTLPSGVLHADGTLWRDESFTVTPFIEALQNRGTLHFADGGCDASFFAVSR